jgi:sugar lactone lactonase YvrE
LAVNNEGVIYFSDPKNKRVWRLDTKGHQTAVNDEVEFPSGVRSSPDQSLLFGDDLETATGADGMTVDDQGSVYVATRVGLQICDQPGRVEAILRKPQAGHFSNVVL